MTQLTALRIVPKHQSRPLRHEIVLRHGGEERYGHSSARIAVGVGEEAAFHQRWKPLIQGLDAKRGGIDPYPTILPEKSDSDEVGPPLNFAIASLRRKVDEFAHV